VTLNLRPYQTQAIDEARIQIREGRKSLLIVAATGAGKTCIASVIVRNAVILGARVLFLAHRKELIDQCSGKLTSLGLPHGIIMGAKRMALQQPVQVASVQTIINRVGQMPKFQLIMVDEAHHVTEGNTYTKLLKAWPDARVIGLTATPWRLDGQGLGDVFDGYVIARTPKQLRDEGFLVPVCGAEYHAPVTDKVAVRGGEFNAAALDTAVRSATLYGDIVNEWKADAGNARTLVFAVSVAHSRELAEAFMKAGVSAEHLDAKTPREERSAVLARLRSGLTRVVCNVGILTEGFDEPSVSCIVLARPTLSTSLFLQMVGRGLRTVCFECGESASWMLATCPRCGSANIKRSARIHDHAGCLKKHGHPYAERDFTPGVSLDQMRDMQARRITDSWGNATPQKAGDTPLTPLLVKMVEEARKTIISADGKTPITFEKKKEELERQAKWKSKTWAEKRDTWNTLVDRHGSVKAKNVYRWMSGFTDFTPGGWLIEARRREMNAALDEREKQLKFEELPDVM
jgi:superfamily II DNA or RNA helicase